MLKSTKSVGPLGKDDLGKEDNERVVQGFNECSFLAPAPVSGQPGKFGFHREGFRTYICL